MFDSSATPPELWYTAAGTRLFATESGRGCPVVFLHGGLADHQASRLHVGGLAADHRLITPDVRAAGRSHFAGPLSWQLLADDLIALLDHLSLECAVIGGSSAGSAIALTFARRYPERTLALLLVSPVYGGAERGLNSAQQHAFARMNEAGQRTLAEGMGALLPLFEALPATIRPIALAMARGFDPASVAETTRFLATGAQPFAQLADLSAIRVPTLIVPGSDPEHPVEIAELYAAALPASRLLASLAELPAALPTLVAEANRSNVT